MIYKNRIAILGDLHYEPQIAPIYRRAMYQILKYKPSRLFNLGDIGGYSYAGSPQSFEDGFQYLSDFSIPFHPLIGNHDLEHLNFATDAEAINSWCYSFAKPKPYYFVKLPNAIGIVLSSTIFREAKNCCHEITIDSVQIQWLKKTLQKYKHLPTFIFSHAPIAGTGIRVIQDIHLTAPNAYLNNTNNPLQFIKLIKHNPQIKLWFSAHNHLGHNYKNTITVKESCTFVHTGTISPVSRDKTFHTRFLEFDKTGFTICTLDHTSGEYLKDFEFIFKDNDYKFLRDFKEPDFNHVIAPDLNNYKNLLQIGDSAFIVNKNMIVEYDFKTKTALGVVAKNISNTIVLTEHNNNLVIKKDNQIVATYKRNCYGWFFNVFFKNDWKTLIANLENKTSDAKH